MSGTAVIIMVPPALEAPLLSQIKELAQEFGGRVQALPKAAGPASILVAEVLFADKTLPQGFVETVREKAGDYGDTIALPELKIGDFRFLKADVSSPSGDQGSVSRAVHELAQGEYPGGLVRATTMEGGQRAIFAVQALKFFNHPEQMECVMPRVRAASSRHKVKITFGLSDNPTLG